MRFPWQKRKVEQPTDFPLKLNTDNLNWCRDARLLLIEGNGTLKWESRGRNEDWSQQYALTLRGTPLIVHNAPDCPTCAGLLATGYGLDKADAPELQQISDVINAPYVDLDTSIASMAPLLGLLSSGLYVIAEGDSFPADGNGNFFWDVPDAFSNVEATLSTRLGAAAGKMILDGEFGYLVGMKNNHIAKIPLADVAGKLKMIQPDDEMVQEAKLMGISFGD